MDLAAAGLFMSNLPIDTSIDINDGDTSSGIYLQIFMLMLVHHFVQLKG